MNNAELIQSLNKGDLLSVIELLCAAIKFPDDDFEELEGYTGYLPDEVFDYLKGLTEYQRLKLMQLILTTLTHEAEQSAQKYFQLSLPLQ